MPNEQLAAYVRDEMVKGVSRSEIAKALLAAGWPLADVNNMMISLGVPMEGAAPAPLPPPPAPPSPPAPAGMPPLNRPLSSSIPSVYVPSAPAPTAAGYTPQPIHPMPVITPDNSGKLPGVIALVKSGINIYRARFGTIFAIAIIEVVVAVALIGLLVFGFVAGAVSAIGLVMTAPSSLPLLLGGALVGGVVFVILFSWVSGWVTLALFHAIRGSAEGIGIGESFRRARPQVWPLIWVGILNGLIILGALTVFVALPIAVVYFGGNAFLGAGSVLVPILMVTLGIFATIAVFCTFVTWLFFSVWVLIDTDTRGINVALASMRMAHDHFGAVLGRFLGIGLLSGLASLPVSIVLSIILLAVPSTARSVISGIVNQAVTFLVIYPVMFGAMYSMYAAVKARTVSVDVTTGRGKIVALAVIGLIALIALPFGAVAVLPSLLSSYAASHHTTTLSGSPNDAIRKTDIAELELYLELYKNQANRYPASLAELSTLSPSIAAITDPVTHMPFSYEADAAGMSYKVCATLDSGDAYCKQYPDSPATMATTTPSQVSGATSAAPQTKSTPTLTAVSESSTSVTVSYTNMPYASVDIIRNQDGKAFREQLGHGNGTLVVTPDKTMLAPGYTYHLEAHDANNVFIIRSATFSVTS